MVETSMVGGVISGYCVIGSASRARAPARVMIRDSTVAKMGRSMKKRDITGAPPLELDLLPAAATQPGCPEWSSGPSPGARGTSEDGWLPPRGRRRCRRRPADADVPRGGQRRDPAPRQEEQR